jgi:hypothetical protein
MYFHSYQVSKVLEAYIWVVVYTFYPTDYLFIYICVIFMPT